MRAAPAERGWPASWTGWAEQALGGQVARVLFRTGNLSTVVGLRLRDGREVVLKARPAAARHLGCAAVQRHLAAAGYPCPLPLAATTLDGHDLALETHHPGGEQLALDDAAPARFAAALAELVRRAPDPRDVPSLEPPPAWAAWDQPSGEPQPGPAGDLAPGWIDDVAERAAARLARDPSPPVVGHVDFESQNLRWVAGRLHCVHDWDSTAARPEAALAGLAAAAFPAVDAVARAASVRDSERFLAAYADARGRAWSSAELEVAWAAGLWTLAYNARRQCLSGGSALADRLAGQLADRLRRAGA